MWFTTTAAVIKCVLREWKKKHGKSKTYIYAATHKKNLYSKDLFNLKLCGCRIVWMSVWFGGHWSRSFHFSKSDNPAPVTQLFSWECSLDNWTKHRQPRYLLQVAKTSPRTFDSKQTEPLTVFKEVKGNQSLLIFNNFWTIRFRRWWLFYQLEQNLVLLLISYM